MIYFGIKKTRHTVELLPRISINLPSRNRNDVVIFGWFNIEIVFGIDS